MKYFSNKKFVIFLLLLVAAVSGAAYSFYFLKTEETSIPTTIAEGQYFPLTPVKDGGYDLGCKIKEINPDTYLLFENTEIQYSLTCVQTTTSGEEIELFIPLVIYNPDKNLTSVLGHGVYSGPRFESLALQNAYSSYKKEDIIVLGFSPIVDEYKTDSEFSLFNLIGDWLQQFQTDQNISDFVQTGDITKLTEFEGKKILVPFFLAKR